MDNKRKAGSSNGAAAGDNDNRAAKRRKVPETAQFDLSKGETPESTTSYGLKLLETIRKVADKSGRQIAGKFEYLPPRDKNKDFYHRISMPISLKTIERKLHNQDFATLSDLESFFKRMITNNKEFYSKGTPLFDDTERIRKALSNYMRVQNPAYTRPGSTYSCQATPLNPNYKPHPDDFASGAGSGVDRESVDEDEGDEDADGEDDVAQEDADADGEVDEDMADNADKGDSDAEGEDEADEDDEGDEDAEGEEDDDDDGVKDRRRIVIKRRASHRMKGQEQSPDGSSPMPNKGGRKKDEEYLGVPYRAVNFQQAQEKIVEELIRQSDDDGPYFIDFHNLPPRSNKQYFATIMEPMSLRALQKLVRGIHGRHTATGVSDFKGWAAFEEKASLLWTNAHFFNEDGSFLYDRATELKASFEKELKEAKAVVQEPPQPKIKLKVPLGQESTALTIGKKITIHVGGSRGSAAASPALPPSQSGETNSLDGATARNETPSTRDPSVGAGTQRPVIVPAKLEGALPSPAVAAFKAEPSNRPSPAFITSRANGTAANGATAVLTPAQPSQQPVPAPPLQNGYPQLPPPPPLPLYDNKFRAPGRGLADALITSVTMRTHPNIHPNNRFKYELSAHPKLAQQNVAVVVPANQKMMQIIPKIAPLEQQLRQFRLYVVFNGMILHRATPLPTPDDPLPPNAVVYEANLQPGSNSMQVHMIAALPKGQRLPNGSDCELEKFTILVHLLRH